MPNQKPAAKTGVLLINLGSPAAPTTKAVRRYLREFLSDVRVVEIPRLLWFFILNGLVLLVRPRKSAAAYAKIWSDEYGSPLVHYTQQQAEGVKALLDVHIDGTVYVEAAMRYGQPGMRSAVERFATLGVEQLLVLPMYPQFSATTTASIVDEVGRLLKQQRNQMALRTIRDFHDNEEYINAMATRIRQYWQAHGRGDQLVFSFHGLPQRCVDKGDPYARQCAVTARLLADALLLSENHWQLSFQSRFGKEAWLQPYTVDVFDTLGRQGTPRIDVFCPGFSADCLETLEEIAIAGAEDFQAAGGGEFHYIPALNDHPAHIDALSHIVEANLQGWERFIEEDSRNPIRKMFNKVAKR